MPRSVNEKDNVHLVQELAEVDGPFESPINLNFRDFIKLELPSLSWNNADATPKRMKMTNTGHTVIINGKWKSERPSLSGGPLTGKYSFSQIHFHWGPDDSNGSEHQISGESFPMEMHVAHFKSEYMTQEAALREKDGIVVLVYLFKIQDKPNTSLKKIINFLPCIRIPNSCRLLDYSSILAICNPFTDDYFMYWGSVVTSTCAHILLWIVCREPFGISKEQLNEFRNLLDNSMSPIKRNGRELQPLHKRNVFHVNPSRHMDVPLLPIKNIWGCFCSSQIKDFESKNSAGDSPCLCDKNDQAQEELEVKQDSCSRQDAKATKGNGILKQTVYVQQATVHTVPALPTNYPDFQERENETDESQCAPFGKVNDSRISQSCCFLSLKESNTGKRKGMKKRRKGRFDSITTLANLIITLETLKSQTYKKLQKMESINDELQEMKSSCENLRERNWLHHAERFLSQQKLFTIKSSQYCFSELKKLAKDSDIDGIVERRTFLGPDEGKSLLFRVEESEFGNFLKSNRLADKSKHLARLEVDDGPFNLTKRKRSFKSIQKLIRNFFEDIRESEEAEVNMKKNFQLKKFKRKPNSDYELHRSARGECAITKNMINLDPIRKKFFIEVKADEKSDESEMVKGRDKKKGSFKISLKAFEGEENKKVKKSFFNHSPMAWLNKRLNMLNDTSPVISLRLTDFELKSGTITNFLKKKSEESIESVKSKEIASKEHICTEIANFISESYVSEYSDKQTKLSKRSRARATGFIHSVETNSDIARSDLSFMRVIKDIDASNFFVRLGNSVDFLSTSSVYDENNENDAAILRRDLWTDDIPSIAKYQKLENKKESCKVESPDSSMKDFECIRSLKNYSGRISPASGSSVFVCSQNGKREPSGEAKTEKEFEEPAIKYQDASVDTTEEKLMEIPMRKKLKLEWKCKNLEVQSKQSPSEIRTISYIETKYHNMSLAESECQVDLGTCPAMVSSSADNASSLDQMVENGEEICRNFITPNYLSTATDLVTEEDKDSPTKSSTDTQTVNEPEIFEIYCRSSSERNISTNKRCGMNQEDFDAKPESKCKYCDVKCTGITSEISIAPERSWEDVCEPFKDFSFEITRTVITDNTGGTFWLQNEPKVIRIEPCPMTRDDRRRIPFVQSENMMMVRKPEQWNQDAEHELRSVAVLICETENCTSIVDPNCIYRGNGSNVYMSNPDFEQDRRLMVNGAEIGRDMLKKLDKAMSHETDDTSSMSWQNEYAKCNLRADTGTGKFHGRTSKPIPGEGIKCLVSSCEEKQNDNPKGTGISNLKINYYSKPYSAETFNSYRSCGLPRCRKKRCSLGKKSMSLIKRQQSIMRRVNKVSSIGLDFMYLPEEEQLKVISANIAKFIREKLMEDKAFFNFENAPTIHENIGDKGTLNANRVKLEIAGGDVGAKRERNREVKRAKMARKQPNGREESGSKITAQNAAPEQAAGDAERREGKNEPTRQQPDFIQLNKRMAGKYKRQPPKKKEQKPTRKETTKETAPKEKKGESPPRSIPRLLPLSKALPVGMKGRPNNAGSSIRESKMSGKTLRTLSADRSRKSGIPVPRASRETSSRRKPSAFNTGTGGPQSKICRPVSASRNSLSVDRKQCPEKKQPIPIYAPITYSAAPRDTPQCQRMKFDVTRDEVAETPADGSNGRNLDRKPKTQDTLLKRNLDCSVRLRNCINDDAPADADNSAGHAKAPPSRNLKVTSVVGKTAAKNLSNLSDSGNGRSTHAEANDQRDCTNLSSELSEESRFGCVHRERETRSRSRASKQRDEAKGNEFAGQGTVDSRMRHGSCRKSKASAAAANPEKEKPNKGYGKGHAKASDDGEPSDSPEKYVYHIGGGQVINVIVKESPESSGTKQLRRRRNERGPAEVPKLETKWKLPNEIEDEMSETGDSSTAEGTGERRFEKRESAPGTPEATRQTFDESDGENPEVTRGDPENDPGTVTR